MEAFGYIVLFAIILFAEWFIGKKIGKAISKGTGLVLGIVLIVFMATFIMGLAIIIYSNKNREIVEVNVNSNLNLNNPSYRNVGSEGNYRFPNVIKNVKTEIAESVVKFIGDKPNNTGEKSNGFIKALQENNLYGYIELFEKNHLTDFDVLIELSESDLEKIGISIIGDRKKILKLIRELK